MSPAAAFVLERAVKVQSGEQTTYTAEEVRNLLVEISRDLEPGDLVDQQIEGRIPLVGNYVAEYLGRLFFRAERVTTDYGRCVQVAQLLGDVANRIDLKGDHARGDLIREYAFGVSQAGNAL